MKYSSTIIADVEPLCKSTSLSTYAYFFFDGRTTDESFVLHENLIRSLLSQLCYRCGGIPAILKDIFRTHGDGREQPSLESLQQTLQLVIEGFDHVYIIIDSLDECGDRAELLRWIETIAGWNSNRLHLLLTSRPEYDITARLDLIPCILHLQLSGPGLERDIGVYLDKQLSLMNCWTEEIRALVKNTLMAGADDMYVFSTTSSRPWLIDNTVRFRWVALHMYSLKNCLKAKQVKEQLKALPRGLDNTYERILAKSEYRQDLYQMLHWLSFSARPLRLDEIAEVVSVDLDTDEGPCYDPESKYGDPRIALQVCSGLVTETDGKSSSRHEIEDS